MSYKRDDGSDLDIEYAVEERGYPSNGWDDAGAPTIIAIIHAYDADGIDVSDQLSEAERERLEGEIAVDVDADDGSEWDFFD